jgi:hypothetical protein
MRLQPLPVQGIVAIGFAAASAFGCGPKSILGEDECIQDASRIAWKILVGPSRLDPPAGGTLRLQVGDTLQISCEERGAGVSLGSSGCSGTQPNRTISWLATTDGVVTVTPRANNVADLKAGAIGRTGILCEVRFDNGTRATTTDLRALADLEISDEVEVVP